MNGLIRDNKDDLLDPYVEKVLTKQPEVIGQNIRGMDLAAKEVRSIMTRIEKTMKLMTTNLAIFKNRWGVEPGLIDRTKPKPGKLFEEDSEEGS